ncbi:YceI family protein [Azohydromonas australica]|uniref:YceI family protein n=1 Tax=Azohydromonas australica TaxID=364039 RepID=UPI000406AAFF|nr:YceI family protein [Azohydromonas australica]
MKKIFALAALAATAAAAVLPAQAATYAIDPSHTFVTFEFPHFGTSMNRGRFDKKEGTVEFDRAARTGRVELTLETGSISTGTAPFDKHLRSDDFFAAEQFPTAKFVADKFSFDGDKVTEVAGQLTLRGKTNPVVLKATRFNCYTNPMLKREVCGGDFETTLQRSLWGVNWGLNMGAPDNVKLVIQVEAIKQ